MSPGLEMLDTAAAPSRVNVQRIVQVVAGALAIWALWRYVVEARRHAAAESARIAWEMAMREEIDLLHHRLCDAEAFLEHKTTPTPKEPTHAEVTEGSRPESEAPRAAAGGAA